MAIMRNEQHGALVARKCLNQHLLGADIEMIGGLIEHEKVGGIVEHLREYQARLFAAGQDATRFVDVVTRKPEHAAQGAQRADRSVREFAHECVPHRLVRAARSSPS